MGKGKLLKVLVQDVDDVDLRWTSGGLPWLQVLTHTHTHLAKKALVWAGGLVTGQLDKGGMRQG